MPGRWARGRRGWALRAVTLWQLTSSQQLTGASAQNWCRAGLTAQGSLPACSLVKCQYWNQQPEETQSNSATAAILPSACRRAARQQGGGARGQRLSQGHSGLVVGRENAGPCLTSPWPRCSGTLCRWGLDAYIHEGKRGVRSEGGQAQQQEAGTHQRPLPDHAAAHRLAALELRDRQLQGQLGVPGLALVGSVNGDGVPRVAPACSAGPTNSYMCSR